MRRVRSIVTGVLLTSLALGLVPLVSGCSSEEGTQTQQSADVTKQKMEEMQNAMKKSLETKGKKSSTPKEEPKKEEPNKEEP